MENQKLLMWKMMMLKMVDDDIIAPTNFVCEKWERRRSEGGRLTSYLHPPTPSNFVTGKRDGLVIPVEMSGPRLLGRKGNTILRKWVKGTKTISNSNHVHGKENIHAIHTAKNRVLNT